MSGYVTRFAPSPTGRLHLGHAAAAFAAWGAAAAAGGRCLLRIEDIDATRVQPEFAAGIEEDLAWLGLDWERPVRRQSEHLAEYRAALAKLEAGGLVYRCFRTRREVLAAMAAAPHADDARDTGAFNGGALSRADEGQRLARGEPFAWRLSLAGARAALGARWESLRFTEQGRGDIAVDPTPHGDVVLARKDVGVAYHLAVVVDDAAQGVTEVVRGDDLMSATHVQRLLQALLQLPTPSYRHHPLRLDAQGRRLAKRHGAPSLQDLRIAGVAPGEIRAMLGS